MDEGNPELNIFKVFFLFNVVITIALLVLLYLTPSHTKMGEIYAWWFLATLMMVIVDIIFVNIFKWSGIEFADIIDTITTEDNPNKFLLQMLGFPLHYTIIIAIIIGVIWGSFYGYSVSVENKVYISVPNLLTASPVPFAYAITAQQFDALQSSITVSNVEEIFFTGLIFPIVWFLIFLMAFFFTREPKSAAVISMFIAALLMGSIASFIYHSFVYGGNLYAYASGQEHFTFAALTAGITGTIIPSLISHAMHNYFVKTSRVFGTYSTLPLQVFIISNADQNRTF